MKKIEIYADSDYNPGAILTLSEYKNGIVVEVDFGLHHTKVHLTDYEEIWIRRMAEMLTTALKEDNTDIQNSLEKAIFYWFMAVKLEQTITWDRFTSVLL